MNYILLLAILFQLIPYFYCEKIELIGLSSLYNPDSININSEFLDLYGPYYEYDIKLDSLNEYDQLILNLTWIGNDDIDPSIVSKVDSYKFEYGIKLLTTAFLRRYIDSHKSTGKEAENLNIYIKNLEDDTTIDFYNDPVIMDDTIHATISNYSEQTYNIIMRNKIGLFLRYSIPDKKDLKIGRITYADLKYAINQICDSFAYEDYKLNNIGLEYDKNIINYLFLSPIWTGFDIEKDVDLYNNYDTFRVAPIGIEHLISLGINNKINLSHDYIVNSIINTSTNTILNYLLSERGSVNY